MYSIKSLNHCLKIYGPVLDYSTLDQSILVKRGVKLMITYHSSLLTLLIIRHQNKSPNMIYDDNNKQVILKLHLLLSHYAGH